MAQEEQKEKQEVEDQKSEKAEDQKSEKAEDQKSEKAEDQKSEKAEEQKSEIPEGYNKQLGNLEYWSPEKEGDFIEGEVMDIFDGMHGKVYKLCLESGELIGTPSHKVLQNALIEAKVGDYLRIEFIGEKESGKGNPTRVYSVFCK